MLNKEKNIVFENKFMGKMLNLNFGCAFAFFMIIIILLFTSPTIKLFFGGLSSVFFLMTFFARMAFKIEFFERYMILYYAPFRRKQYRIEDIKITLFLVDTYIITIKRNILWLPYFLLVLDSKDKKHFNKYISARKDIEKLKIW